MMSGRVRTKCDRCGVIDVAAVDVTIIPIIATIENIYRFRCPRCAEWNVKDAGPAVVGLLLRAGVRVASLHDEVGEPPDARLGPITDADLVAFHEQLERLPTTEPDT